MIIGKKKWISFPKSNRHFPFYTSWDSVWLNKQLVNWSREGMTIDKFLKKYEGYIEVAYRFWKKDKKRMTYLRINFPEKYDEPKIYLKDIIIERAGAKFLFILMRQIMNTHVEKINEIKR